MSTSIEEIEARMAAHDTPGGLHITYDDGQNVRVEGMEPCPFCGPVEGGARRPYVQVRMLGILPNARAVCPACFCSTAPYVPDCLTYEVGGRNVTRDLAIEAAVSGWNRRAS